MLTKDFIFKKITEDLCFFQKEYGVKKIGVFGSFVRNEQSETSDIDILVEFNEKAISFDNYMDLKFHLEDAFEKPVDLVMLQDIKPTLKTTILRSVIYAEGA